MFSESNAVPEAAEAGEEYFVSMTDMMVGMLFPLHYPAHGLRA
jgi:hypothetical protein